MDAPNIHPPEAERSGLRARLASAWRLLRGVESPARAGLSVGLGVFIGCLPVYGLHLPLCLLICLPLRLDAVLAYVGANVSNPFFAPVLLSLELQLGSLLLTGKLVPLELAAVREMGVLGVVREVVVGSVALGALLGCVLGMLTYTLARWRRAEGPLDAAIRRTAARYGSAPVGDRIYVRSKLRFDPVLRAVAELGPLGHVLDAGAGRGQLALALMELGHARSVSGFDLDARKVEIANVAARGAAHFDVADVRSATFPSADTILLVDVLHYLPLPEQDALLARARQELRPNGKLVVREVDARATPFSWLSRVLEHVLTRAGYNRATGRLAFRPAREIAERLTALGLSCRNDDAAQGTPFDNRLIVGVAPPLPDI